MIFIQVRSSGYYELHRVSSNSSDQFLLWPWSCVFVLLWLRSFYDIGPEPSLLGCASTNFRLSNEPWVAIHPSISAIVVSQHLPLLLLITSRRHNLQVLVISDDRHPSFVRIVSRVTLWSTLRSPKTDLAFTFRAHSIGDCLFTLQHESTLSSYCLHRLLII